MILANLSRAIREQNYYAVVLEFVIVLAGVVIGFQVSVWAQTRAERERETLLLNRLDADFSDLSDRAADGVAQCETGRENALALSALLADAPSQDRAELARAVTLSIGTPVPVGRSATYVELLASGEMALIRSEPLRSALVDFDEQVRRHELAYGGLSNLVTQNSSILLETASLAASPSAQRLGDAVQARLESAELAAASQLMALVNARSCFWLSGVQERAGEVLALTGATASPPP
jgi:hypothetical protein